MSINVSADKLITDADAGSRIWKANPELKLKDVSIKEYDQTRAALQKVVAEAKALEDQIGVKMTERDTLASQLNEMNTRLRSAAKGYFGPDSAEYEQLGGTRSSDRKKTRKPAAAPVEAA